LAIIEHMILYNVTVKIDRAIDADWLQWMRERHIPEVMDTGIFTENKLYRLLDQDESEGITYAIQYACRSRADLATVLKSMDGRSQ